jgi:S-adenosylmethionine hydrolase
MKPISFLTDYGLADEFVGVCKGVLHQLAPGAPIVDITHLIAPHDVRAGSPLSILEWEPPAKQLPSKQVR